MKAKINGTEVDIKNIAGIPLAKLFEMAGYDYSKFNTASPQGFFDSKNRLGIKDHYGWYYGDSSKTFGRPLGVLEVLYKLWNKLYVVEVNPKVVEFACDQCGIRSCERDCPLNKGVAEDAPE